MSKVTIGDIARRAGVSKTAVSFAFNNPGRLSQETAKHILAIAEELGYMPNPVARSMNTGRTGTIGVLLPQPMPEIIRNPFLPEFLEGVGEVCARANLSLMLVPPVEGSMRRAIVNAAVDGFLTLGLEEHKSTMIVLRQRGVPYVTVDSDPHEGVPSVNIDDQGGAHSAMQYVLDQGHREILILAIRSGKMGKYQEYAGTLHYRMNGYLEALSARGLSLDGKRVRLAECVSNEKGGRDYFQRLWKAKHKPTAIIAMSDIIAIGIMREALEAGLNIPEDLSIVGFDNIPLSAWVNPALTTVSQPLNRKGTLAAEILLSLLEGKSDPTHHVLPTELIIRKSVATR